MIRIPFGGLRERAMSEETSTDSRRPIFHFIDGTQLAMEWPKLAPKGVFALENAVQKAVTASQFLVEVEGNLRVIQMANVKFIEVIPAPERLPDGVIRNARRVE